LGAGGYWVGRKAFFFEKKKQKAFMRAVADLSGDHPTGDKSFLVLFFKKELLAFSVSAFPKSAFSVIRITAGPWAAA
jgi:hypothetical protein